MLLKIDMCSTLRLDSFWDVRTCGNSNKHPTMKVSEALKQFYFWKYGSGVFFQRNNVFLSKLLLGELLQERQGSHWTTSHHPLGWCKMTSVVPQGPGKGKVSQSLPSIVIHSIRELLTNCCWSCTPQELLVQLSIGDSWIPSQKTLPLEKQVLQIKEKYLDKQQDPRDKKLAWPRGE